eukprot:g32941.t1
MFNNFGCFAAGCSYPNIIIQATSTGVFFLIHFVHDQLVQKIVTFLEQHEGIRFREQHEGIRVLVQREGKRVPVQHEGKRVPVQR